VSDQSAPIRLSTEHKGRHRREPVWIGRYRIVGKDSAKVLGKAWTRRSAAPDGYLTHSQAEAALRQFLAAEGATVTATRGAIFDEVADTYVTSLRGRIKNGSFRASTLRTYENIIAKEISPLWGRRKISSVTREEIAAYRTRLAARDLAPSTLNQTRAILRTVFATAVERFGLEDDPSIAFKRAKTRRATSDKISFYPPDEVMRLVEHSTGHGRPVSPGSSPRASTFSTPWPVERARWVCRARTHDPISVREFRLLAYTNSSPLQATTTDLPKLPLSPPT
jgi:hypothetical protein